MGTVTRGSGSVVEHLLAKEKVTGSIPVSRFILSRQSASDSVALHGSAQMQPTGYGSHRFYIGTSVDILGGLCMGGTSLAVLPASLFTTIITSSLTLSNTQSLENELLEEM